MPSGIVPANLSPEDLKRRYGVTVPTQLTPPQELPDMTWPLEMTQEQVEDEAAVYCPVAVHYIKTGSWENAARVLLTALKCADMALQSATPGGSEYVGNVDRCAEHIRELKSDAMKWRLQAARRKHL